MMKKLTLPFIAAAFLSVEANGGVSDSEEYEGELYPHKSILDTPISQRKLQKELKRLEGIPGKGNFLHNTKIAGEGWQDEFPFIGANTPEENSSDSDFEEHEFTEEPPSPRSILDRGMSQDEFKKLGIIIGGKSLSSGRLQFE